MQLLSTPRGGLRSKRYRQPGDETTPRYEHLVRMGCSAEWGEEPVSVDRDWARARVPQLGLIFLIYI